MKSLLRSFMLFPLMGYTQDAESPIFSEAEQNLVHVSHTKISGKFEILWIGPRIGIFRFMPTNDPGQLEKKVTVAVDAGVGGDVRAAVIARMIVLIREYYKENFKWDSNRLGRVVVLSARPEDEASLTTFLWAEFFEPKVTKPAE